MESLRKPYAKTRGTAGPKGFGRGTSRGTPFTIIPPRLINTFSFFIQPMDSLGTELENGEDMKPYILVELNPNILGRDVERMHFMLFNKTFFFTSTALVIITFFFFINSLFSGVEHYKFFAVTHCIELHYITPHYI